jgi:hypothetical protein
MPDAVPPRRSAAPALPPSVYAGLIHRLAPEEDPAHVEAWLRREHGALDDIPAAGFAGAIVVAAEHARAADRERNDALARTYGLAPSS